MKISVIHPSRGRPVQAFKTANNWYTRADNKDFQYMFSMDADDDLLDNYDYWENIRGVFSYDLQPEVLVTRNKSAIEAINKAARLVTGNLFIIVSDDMDCPPHWDTLLLEALKDKEDFCVKTNDGFQKFIMTLPIMDRKYYDRFGYIYYPGYGHMYADTEMTAVAHMLGRNLTLDIPFTHNHYLAGKGKKDAINEKNNLTFASGRQLFNERSARNFDLINPVKQFTEIRLK